MEKQAPDMSCSGEEYLVAEALASGILPQKSTSFASRVLERVAQIQRNALAQTALAAVFTSSVSDLKRVGY